MLIYKITNLVNGKLYIGQTIYSIERRWYFHVYDAKRKLSSRSLLYRAIRKYGKHSFKIEKLCDVGTREELSELEKLIINEVVILYGKEYVYNLSPGGEDGFAFTKGRTYEEIHGEVKGKKLKALRSKALKGIIRTKESIEKSRLSRLGIRPSEEVRIKLSQAKLGEKNHFYGRHHTEESKKKIGSRDYTKQSGKNSPMAGRSVFSVWVEKYGQEEAELRLKKQIEKCKNTKKLNGTNKHSEETREKMRHPHNIKNK